MTSKKRWTDEELVAAVKNSICWADVARALGLSHRAAARHLRDNAARLNISFEHFDRKKAMTWSRGPHGGRVPRRKPLKEILVRGKYFNTTHLKNRLLNENVFDYACAECSLKEWRGKPLTLQLDHINGDNADNRLENLRILCPNCHTQTPTWGTKGRTWAEPDIKNLCCGCHIPISPGARRCQSCTSFRQPTKIAWPPTETLRQMLAAKNFLAVGRELGVSDNAIRKRLKNHPE